MNNEVFMKFEGFKEVKCICYPNDFITVKKKPAYLNFIIFNLIICLLAASAIVAVKYFGGKALEVLDIIADALSGSSPF
jgi:hypothetical protein